MLTLGSRVHFIHTLHTLIVHAVQRGSFLAEGNIEGANKELAEVARLTIELYRSFRDKK